ncbi:Tad domain-containing protein [Novosphingobium sp. MMS21-SN21R]|uniref:Tad domain-containing protein n=1 Tax=Novosphingobium sp. MMS21-SN21R TaxID=2969298 RepID=UPI0028844A57|nr:Tad domain-containing protein [Novosphingobium sp. MMS21-SN21R]MDT0508105.1 Tad domain-containing protein [Novosphingobium sp. MMS21-SN21R]
MPSAAVISAVRLLRAVARDDSGNALSIIAFSIIPLLALVGSSIDMGRAYLVQSRLQQACDAGVLGARKELGAIDNFDADTDGAMVASKGNRFFNVNFADGIYNSIDRDFQMAIEDDMSISGIASVIVPTDIMQFFGKDEINVDVSCRAELSIPNTDIMMALDVTGSMAETNPGDTAAKISVLKTVVKQFYNTMETTRQPESRIRYGFVPYSTNVNVGSLLKDEWVVSSWNYPSRTLVGTSSSGGLYGYYSAVSPVSGGYSTAQSTYAATQAWDGSYSCPHAANSMTTSTALVSTTTQATTNPSGTRTTYTYNRTRNGNVYSATRSGSTCTLSTTSYSNYVDTYKYITEPSLGTGSSWLYKDVTKDTANWRTESNGCIEERKTYEIDDYDNVDLDRAMDLDLDMVPSAGDPDTQWRPMYPSMIYERSKPWSGGGTFTTAEVTTNAEYISPYVAGFAACPTAAKKLQVWTQADYDAYIDGLVAAGSTYHDIGMIWAGRLLSGTGIFAAENADVSARQRTSRHLIFLTDGQTSSLDISYSSYGVEPLAQRRWSPASALTLTQTIEKRFSFACEEAKKKNMTVWFVAFGTDLNPIMTQCAGAGHYFSAANADELQDAFVKIAKSIGDLRLAQ